MTLKNQNMNIHAKGNHENKEHNQVKPNEHLKQLQFKEIF